MSVMFWRPPFGAAEDAPPLELDLFFFELLFAIEAFDPLLKLNFWLSFFSIRTIYGAIK